MSTCAVLEISFPKENWKTCAFTFQNMCFQISGILQNMCFDIAFCTGSGRRTPALQIAKNLYGAVAPPVDCLFEEIAAGFFLFTKCFHISKHVLSDIRFCIGGTDSVVVIVLILMVLQQRGDSRGYNSQVSRHREFFRRS